MTNPLKANIDWLHVAKMIAAYGGNAVIVVVVIGAVILWWGA